MDCCLTFIGFWITVMGVINLHLLRSFLTSTPKRTTVQIQLVMRKQGGLLNLVYSTKRSILQFNNDFNYINRSNYEIL